MHARVIREEETSAEKIPPYDWPVGKCIKHFLDRWLVWESQHIADSATPGRWF